MLIDASPRTETRIDYMLTLFVCVATLVEAICSLLREHPSNPEDLVLYMMVAIGFCVFTGYQTARRLMVMPGVSCAGMIGTVVTVLMAAGLVFLGKGLSYTTMFIIPLMPVSYVFAAKMGRELYVCVLNGEKRTA